MATFGDIQTSVSARLLDPNNVAVSSSEVGNAINEAISYWKFRRFWFNEVSDSATLTAQNGSFPYPADFLVPALDDDGFNIQYSNMRYTLKKISMPVYDNVWLGNGYGIPQFYARIGNSEYQCYPMPDRDYVVNRHYLRDYAPLVNLNDTNDFTDHAHILIRNWALADLSGELRQDDKMETYYRARASDEYRNLRVMTDKANASGKLTIYSTLIS